MAIVSMGLQTCALQQIGGQTIRTTYVSGVLTNLTQESVNYLFWLSDRRNGASYLDGVLGLGSRRESMKRALLLGSIWSLYLAGTVWGSYAEDHWRLWSLAFPLEVLAIAIVADLWRPINAVEQTSDRSGA